MLPLSQPRHNYLLITYLQAPSEGIKDDWVSALKLMVAYTKLGSLSSHAERMKLEDALVSRRFVRQVNPNPIALSPNPEFSPSSSPSPIALALAYPHHATLTLALAL